MSSSMPRMSREARWEKQHRICPTTFHKEIIIDLNSKGGNDSQEVDGLLQGDFDGRGQLRDRLQGEHQPLHQGARLRRHLPHRHDVLRDEQLMLF